MFIWRLDDIIGAMFLALAVVGFIVLGVTNVIGKLFGGGDDEV